MFDGVRGLFQRYAAENLDLVQPGFVLRDELGDRIGHIDGYGIANNRVYVTGWTTAPQVGFTVEEHRIVATPNLPRNDVAPILDPGMAVDVGFYLDQPAREARMLLSVEIGDFRYIYDLPPIPSRLIKAARRKLFPAFLFDLLRASPSAIRWRLYGRLEDRAAFKRRMQLTEEPGHNMSPGIPLFPSADAAPDWPKALDQTAVTIVLPVYNAFDLLPEVLDRVLRHTDLPWHLVMVEDCSTDKQVRPWLKAWAARQEDGCITLIENGKNKGFIRSVNSAFVVARERGDHVILLNSDAFVPEGWASRLIRPFLVHDRVASVTPMSNDAEIFTAPVICQRNDLSEGEADRVDQLARQFHPDADLAEAPTGVGFCMAINIAFLEELPEFDTSFGRGYGEEVDWCQRARELGGRHLGLPSLFVEHRGGSSFGSAEKLKLVRKNNAKIAKRYHSYDQQVQDFIRTDPLATPRFALGLALAAERVTAPVPVYLAHDMGGGAEMYLERRIVQDIAQGGVAAVLRVGGPYRWQMELHTETGITRAVSEDFIVVKQILEILDARRIIYSCGVGDRNPIEIPNYLLALKREGQDQLEVLFHDFFPISPSYCLLNSDGHFHGAPTSGFADKAHQTRQPNGKRISLPEWQKEWGALLSAADDIVVFSHDSRQHVETVYPDTADFIRVIPHELLVAVSSVSAPVSTRKVIGILGNIGLQKGAAVLSQLSRVLARDNTAGLVVIGNVDPSFSLQTPAKIHGSYQIEDIPELVKTYGITDWLIPSIWPETFSYATHEALATGLPVYCFGIGAQSEAVAKAQNGTIIPMPDDRTTLPLRVIEAIR